MPATPTAYGRPGVYTSEQLSGPTPALPSISPSVMAMAGEHWTGVPGIAVLCNSWGDFVNYFGGFPPSGATALTNPYLGYSVYEFFQNGGGSLWVQRVVSSSQPGAAATLTLQLDGSATPQYPLTVVAGYLGNAGNVGINGNNISVSVTLGSASNRFGLNVYYKGGLVEQWPDMSLDPTDYRYARSLINSATGGSMYIVITADEQIASSVNWSAVTTVETNLAGGLDPTTPSNTDFESAVTVGTSPFDKIVGALTIALPGITTAAVITALNAYAEARASTFAVLDTPSGNTPAEAVSYAQTLGPVSSYAAVYYPWLQARNPASSNLQASVLLPPSGFVMGQMVATDNAIGPWKAPGGLSTNLAGVVAAERVLTPGDFTTLNDANVNALKTRGNGQVVIWGVRTMQAGYASLYVSVRRTLNYIEAYISNQLEAEVFAPNDQSSWDTVTAMIEQFLNGLVAANAFPSSDPSQDYYVICDSTNNTPTLISQGILTVTVGLALMEPAEFIQFNIQQFNGGGTTVSQPQLAAA